MLIESGNSPDLQDSFYLSDLSPTDKPWDKHRSSASRVGQLYAQTDLTRYSERVNECSKRLEFIFRADDLGEVRLRLYAAKFCRVRHCPVCQWRRSLMWRARFFQVIPKLLEVYPTSRFLFLTLTVRNCELTELRSTITHMNNAWKLLTKRKQFPALGWVKTVEVTRSKDGFAHPHFHIILMVKEGYFKRGYLSKAKWQELWQSCLKIDYLPILDVKVIKPSEKLHDSKNNELEPSMLVALCETLKYSVKESDLTYSAEFLKELTTQLYKTRAIALGGVFKEYLSEDEPEDLIHTDLDTQEVTEDDLHVWFGWREMVKRYSKE